MVAAAATVEVGVTEVTIDREVVEATAREGTTEAVEVTTTGATEDERGERLATLAVELATTIAEEERRAEDEGLLTAAEVRRPVPHGMA